MYHIISFSGGKDSTAMLLMMVEKGMQIDEIIFADTGKEFKELYEHIKQVENYINRKITVIKSEHNWDYYMFNYERTRGKNKGKKGFGFPNPKMRWCTSALKTRPIKKYLDNKYGKNNYITYIGIAFDEILTRNKKANNPNIKYPLVEWKITEQQALQYCYSKGFTWGGLYNHFNRVSCRICPFQSKKDLFMLYTFYPEIWNEIKELEQKLMHKKDAVANLSFKKNTTIEQLEQEFSTIFKKESD